jgi:hypothetical protein
MPVLWNPSVQTVGGSEPTYTCLLQTTQEIAVGVMFRFQMWDSNTTYLDAQTGEDLASWDLIVSTAIPANKTLVLVMREVNTALWEFNGATTYASGGAGIAATYFGLNKTLFATAYVPTASGVTTTWAPANGEPMFGIGFYEPETPGAPCVRITPVGAMFSAPNLPNQFSSYPSPWKIKYTVVYPSRVTALIEGVETCIDVTAIQYSTETYVTGEWSNLRNHISQPWTTIRENFDSVNRWAYRGTVVGEPSIVVGWTDPTPGPFRLAAAPGQLVPVYWQPRYQNIRTADEPIDAPVTAAYQDSGAAQIGLAVTAPLQPGQSIYFTIDEYNDVSRGFGPRNPTTGAFIRNQPSFVWTVGAVPIAAGTVVFIDNIGADLPSSITIQNAHYSSADVGAITVIPGNPINGKAVVSLIVLGAWLQSDPGEMTITPIADKVVCAALSDQYAGDFPPLSPTLTINPSVWVGQNIYMQGQTINMCGNPGSVLAPVINAAEFTELVFGTIVPPQSMPFFEGLHTWTW